MPLNRETRRREPSRDIPMGGFAMKFDDYALD
jgi:hypothetical protein